MRIRNLIGLMLLAASPVFGEEKPSGSWRTDPVPREGKAVVEFFEDGTALITVPAPEESRLLSVRKGKALGEFELVTLHKKEGDEQMGVFAIKSPKVAVLILSGGRAIRFVPGTIDD